MYPCLYYLPWVTIDTILFIKSADTQPRLHETSGFKFVTQFESCGTIRQIILPVMTSVCITPEYHTIIYYDARFDPQTIRINMF